MRKMRKNKNFRGDVCVSVSEVRAARAAPAVQVTVFILIAPYEEIGTETMRMYSVCATR